jgi:hypothetical protein
VIAFYPLSGNDHNTGPRFQEEAELTGFDILGITRDGSDTYVPSVQCRKRFSTDNFDRTMESAAESLNRLAEGYTEVVMRGQSTGSFPTLSVLKTGKLRATRLLIEDGINTRISATGGARGLIGSRLDWLRYGKAERRSMPSMEAPGQARSGLDSLKSLAKFAVEQYHWAPLWRSSYSRDALLEVASTQPLLPILVKFLGHTGTSTEAEVMSLQRQLDEVSHLRAQRDRWAAPLRSEYDPDGWHGYLIDPKFGARNLVEVMSMPTHVVPSRAEAEG